MIKAIPTMSGAGTFRVIRSANVNIATTMKSSVHEVFYISMNAVDPINPSAAAMTPFNATLMPSMSRMSCQIG